MTQESTAVSEAYALIGREILPRMQQQGEEAAAEALAKYPYRGVAVIKAGTLQVRTAFDTGDDLEYTAQIPGAPGGSFHGGGAFDIPPGDLLKGPMVFTADFSLLGLNIAFIRDGEIVGSFAGFGTPVANGIAGGSGAWKRL